MHPVTRQRTRESILSWWSDSNPPGPSINLHAVAKPLIRLMYQQQALAFIRQAHGAPLSRETTELYASYLAFKYVSRSTKAAVLREVCERAASEDDARIVTDSLALYPIAELLDSRDTEVRRWTCNIIAQLARHKTTSTAILRIRPCERLVTLSRDNNLEVIEWAVSALSWISASPEGAQAALDANILNCVPELLESKSAGVREWTCYMLSQLARHQPMAALLDITSCRRLVSLLHDNHCEVIQSAAEALNWISTWPDGVQAAVETNLLACVADRLESPNPRVRESMCKMLSGLVQHETMVVASWDVKLCQKLVALLHDEDMGVIESATRTLTRIAKSPKGAQAAVGAKVLNCIGELLESPGARVREWACSMLGLLAGHGHTVQAVLDIKPCQKLASLFRDENVWVNANAAEALYWITKSPEGAQAAVDAGVLGECLASQLDSLSSGIRRCTCWMLGELASHRSTATAVLGVKPCVRLVSNLDDKCLRPGSVFALVKISQYPDGVAALAATNILAYVSSIMESRDRKLQLHTCIILRNLSQYKPRRPVLPSERHPQ